MTEYEFLASSDPAAMLRLATGRVSLCCGCFWCNNGDGTESLADGQECCRQCSNDTPAAGYRQISTDRKLRLFMAACCRNRWHRLDDDRLRRAVDVAERFADGAATRSEAGAASRAAGQVWSMGQHSLPGCVAALADPLTNLRVRVRDILAYANPYESARRLRDVVGNPFRPGLPTWRCGCPNSATPRPDDRVRPDTRCAGCGCKVCHWITPESDSLARAAYECRDSADGHLDRFRLCLLADALEDAGCPEAAVLDHLRSLEPHVRGCWAVDLVLGKE